MFLTTMLTKNSVSGNPYLVPDHKRVSQLFIVEYHVTVGFHYDHYHSEIHPFYKIC